MAVNDDEEGCRPLTDQERGEVLDLIASALILDATDYVDDELGGEAGSILTVLAIALAKAHAHIFVLMGKSGEEGIKDAAELLGRLYHSAYMTAQQTEVPDEEDGNDNRTVN